MWLGMVMHAVNLSRCLGSRAGGSLWVPGQPGLHSAFPDSQVERRPCFKTAGGGLECIMVGEAWQLDWLRCTFTAWLEMCLVGDLNSVRLTGRVSQHITGQPLEHTLVRARETEEGKV